MSKTQKGGKQAENREPDTDQEQLEDSEQQDEPLAEERAEASKDEVLADDATPAELAERIAELEAANAKLADQFVRAKAETENTRRIADKELTKARKFALEGFARELLLVKDSLDQASLVKLDEADETLIEQMREGLSLTLRQLEQVFDKFHIEEVKPEPGDELDPELHQPMTMQPHKNIAANKVIETIQKGFTLNDRLLRPAMVIVSSGKG